MTRDVSSAEAAGDRLLQFTKRRPKWNLAVRVCIAVIADEMPPEEARKRSWLRLRRRRYSSLSDATP
ncbi:hypothetical protein NKK52_25435 [Mesorhizobium sp. C277A]